MLRFLLGRGERQKRPAGPPDRRAYAIGDVHGRLDLLKALLDQLEADHRRRETVEKTYLVMLGDLIDRGGDSRGVIDLFVSKPPRWATVIQLKGNHEEFFSRVLDGEAGTLARWLSYGGLECVESYGISRGWLRSARPEEILDLLLEKVPPSHRSFLEELADSFKFGDYLFVHAGVRPNVDISQQDPRDLRWIREEFLEDASDHGAMIVHGHTIVDQPEERSNRIAIDTGAYKTGVLTALGLQDEERWIIQARL